MQFLVTAKLLLPYCAAQHGFRLEPTGILAKHKLHHTHIYIYIPEKCRKELQISNTAPAAIVNLERNQVRASMSCVFHIQRKVGWQLNTLRLGKLARTLKMKLCSHFYLRTSTGPCHATSVPAQLPLLM